MKKIKRAGEIYNCQWQKKVWNFFQYWDILWVPVRKESAILGFSVPLIPAKPNKNQQLLSRSNF